MISVSLHNLPRFRGGLAWITYPKKDMAVTFSYYHHCTEAVLDAERG